MLRKAKNCSRLLESQKVAPKAKSCPNVADQQQQTQQSFYSQYSEVQRGRKNENTRNCRKRNDRNCIFITIYTILESVCNSHSSKAFELAAA